MYAANEMHEICPLHFSHETGRNQGSPNPNRRTFVISDVQSNVQENYETENDQLNETEDMEWLDRTSEANNATKREDSIWLNDTGNRTIHSQTSIEEDPNRTVTITRNRNRTITLSGESVTSAEEWESRTSATSLEEMDTDTENRIVRSKASRNPSKKQGARPLKPRAGNIGMIF